MSFDFDADDPIFRSLQLGPHPMPGLWNYYMPKEFLSFNLPKERCSTCMSCPKVREESWRNDYRCCTYHPRVPNYSLGLALMTPQGKKALKRSKTKGMLTPEGMSHSPDQYSDYLADLEEDKFGRSERVQCPMLDTKTGYCNIHAYRNSVCSTFFCLNDHGDVGDQFWSSVQLLVGQIEIAISQWCLQEIGVDINAYIGRLNSLSKNIAHVSDAKTRGFTDQALKYLWGDLYGKEMKVYKECARLVSDYREHLWEIACGTTILDADDFDQAVLRNVPKSLQHHIDEAEWQTGGEASSPKDLWAQVLKNYFKIWNLPAYDLLLSQKVVIQENEQQSSSDLVYKDRPYKLHLRERRGGDEDELVLYLSRQEERILSAFKTPTTIDWQFLSGELAQSHDDAKSFLIEAFSKKILVRSRRR